MNILGVILYPTWAAGQKFTIETFVKIRFKHNPNPPAGQNGAHFSHQTPSSSPTSSPYGGIAAAVRLGSGWWSCRTTILLLRAANNKNILMNSSSGWLEYSWNQVFPLSIWKKKKIKKNLWHEINLNVLVWVKSQITACDMTFWALNFFIKCFIACLCIIFALW